MPKAGIYIHIPFCRAKCIYCDFYSLAGQEELLPTFVKALVQEISSCSIDTSSWIIETLFLGGGTPSLLAPSQLETILQALHEQFSMHQVKEITLEVNPGTATANALFDYHALGINRLSIGIQSLEPALLRWLSRIHTVQESYQTYNTARKVGFDNINCDLLFGVPGQTPTIWKRDLKRILELQPEHISAYSLTVEAGTPLHHQVKERIVCMPDEETTTALFRETHRALQSAGYEHYEISNYALPGKHCLHNLHYWEIKPYLGFGPSAYSFDGTKRWCNVSSVETYLQRSSQGQSQIAHQETLSKTQLLNEIIGFGLRTSQGVNLHRIPKPFRRQLLQRAFREGSPVKLLLQLQNHHLTPTLEGMLYADALAVELIFNNENQ
jgi:oxygen-independent coproporphyrinogen-3 oxidase